MTAQTPSMATLDSWACTWGMLEQEGETYRRETGRSAGVSGQSLGIVSLALGGVRCPPGTSAAGSIASLLQSYLDCR